MTSRHVATSWSLSCRSDWLAISYLIRASRSADSSGFCSISSNSSSSGILRSLLLVFHRPFQIGFNRVNILFHSLDSLIDFPEQSLKRCFIETAHSGTCLLRTSYSSAMSLFNLPCCSMVANISRSILPCPISIRRTRAEFSSILTPSSSIPMFVYLVFSGF